ncbi:beta-ketoacyl-[acyl-carrier-protein] synthase II [Candidatus Desantisbacteria bacterium CG2_30_40_21]|uniref:3-oxoacyl-[acyl-carrier-protein] synthase 2 n=5 Tax=unclassified Candidatus Desantisiibacteriota TaxID=3106372 RepID=A0A2M7JDA8_9BACT|nr:MAG: beta-ketoacyl-[acyl-carrier-protein] synthase II [Candidatus Desantisbacteria bacterium CG2_30_40_21]PIP39937.1 MAG: beta-ketoacyl-[acyl-carrier-protein] synthase II [Candidatus Desantisbacteria bacterium CG23_combo_of_CG06-09_8_20_14_all_40_23]PIX17415.1 MAG: beta-ketoacyl-[acyl-carrier-protein] synthase II [Candidatus Desantisbacteria bacterium CG_4_8_14_3_um_filter_40_12]PIY20478.1 MAG: beta-ketoacyl-[acyl-carrier-protein] synthase II [Candidatus Desantisbacteria bacterium CG_4_10_14_
MERKRVVITGIGVITPVGLNKDDFWKSLIEGKSGVSRIDAFDPEGYPCQIAAQVRGFEPSLYMDKKDIKRTDRFCQLAIAAAMQAVSDARLDMSVEDATKVGVYIGSGIGGVSTIEREAKVLAEKGPRRVTPFLVPMMIIDMASGMISIMTGAKGPNSAVVTACATGSHAIGDAANIIRRGDADVMITGGSEAAITPLTIAGFGNMKALSSRDCPPEETSCPFDKRRDGFVMGEGAGVVILESLEHAINRGAYIYGELAGYGMTGDAYHITSPSPCGDGGARAMQVALSDAGLSPRNIDYINSHGTSTQLNDKFETMAIKSVFGEHAYSIPISSIKSMIGHLLGAAGAIEIVACILSIRDGIIPPTINYQEMDPECDLDYVPNQARKMPVDVCLSNSFGFGGHNAVLIVRKCNAERGCKD